MRRPRHKHETRAFSEHTLFEKQGLGTPIRKTNLSQHGNGSCDMGAGEERVRTGTARICHKNLGSGVRAAAQLFYSGIGICDGRTYIRIDNRLSDRGGLGLTGREALFVTD